MILYFLVSVILTHTNSWPQSYQASHHHSIMEVVFTSERRRKLMKEEERINYISRLNDAIVGDIISLVPTKDDAHTQVLSSHWCQIWCSALVNLDLNLDLNSAPSVKYIPAEVISSILSTLRVLFTTYPFLGCNSTIRATPL